MYLGISVTFLTFAYNLVVSCFNGGVSSEILVRQRLKGVHFFGLIFIAFLGDLTK